IHVVLVEVRRAVHDAFDRFGLLRAGGRSPSRSWRGTTLRWRDRDLELNRAVAAAGLFGLDRLQATRRELLLGRRELALYRRDVVDLVAHSLELGGGVGG